MHKPYPLAPSVGPSGRLIKCRNSRFTFRISLTDPSAEKQSRRVLVDSEPIKAQISARFADPNLCETLAGLRATMKYDAREDRRTADHAE